ncbi:hypothetical protein ACIQAC_18075 [Streptomyces sp. NPDC088387]|uniref:hypothetical protein n=1 Tax=Streptomyces sp. NPDC088387 TaxID=3365859 RepID=UPI00380844FB
MDPVIVGAAVTVVISVVNGVVKIAQRRSAADVEIARISEAAQTARIRCARPVPAELDGGGRDGGRTRY